MRKRAVPKELPFLLAKATRNKSLTELEKTTESAGLRGNFKLLCSHQSLTDVVGSCKSRVEACSLDACWHVVPVGTQL